MKINDPFVLLPPAWKITRHVDQEIVVPGTDRWLPQTIYERSTDQLRVIVTDDVTPVGVERMVSMSAPHGATATQTREVKRLFLKPDVKYNVRRGHYNTNVELFTQVIEGENEKRTDTVINTALMDRLVANSDCNEFTIDNNGEMLKIQFNRVDGWWRYSFLLPSKKTNIHSTHEWQTRFKAATAVAMHTALVDTFNPNYVSEGRMITNKQS